MRRALNTNWLLLLLLLRPPPQALESDAAGGKAAANGGVLLEEKLAPRKKLPPLLVPLSEQQPEAVHWLGTSFGLTPSLFRFWSKSGYQPLYLRQTPNELTGEHSIVMLRPLDGAAVDESVEKTSASQKRL